MYNTSMLKLVAIALILTACTTKPQPPTVDLAELRQITVNTTSCANLDATIIWLEQQQQAQGITPTAPELLNEHDREYQARIRAMVWALRIGCANPGRYL